jgi:hypothetical protein
MAIQSVQVNVIQDSSGSGVRVAWSWTSDGTVVKTGKLYFRQPGGYTLDASLVQVLANQVAETVRDTLRTEQLF